MAQTTHLKLSIGNDTFEIGKEIVSFSLTIGEGKKQNIFSATINDVDGYYADKYMSASYQSGGIDLPIQFLESSDDEPLGNTPNTNTAVDTSGNGTVSKGGVFTPQVRAFLDAIAWKEAAPGEALSIQGYYSNNGVGSSTGFFTEAEALNKFPASAGERYNIGRYQFRNGDWRDAKKRDGNIKGFLPADQDRVAYYKLNYRNALPYLLRGDIKKALDKASYEWASIPGIDKPKGQYNQVQSGVTLDQFVDYYTTRLSYYNSINAETDLQASRPKDTSNNNYKSTEYKVKRVLNESVSVTYYGKAFAGRKTASGEIFNPNTDYTAAHETLPFNTLVKCTWLLSGKSVVVRINDRGAFVRLGRQLDLSEVAARALSSPTHDAIAAGVLTCKLEIVEPATSSGFTLKNTAKEQAGKSIEKIKQAKKESPVAEVSAKGTQITAELTIDRSAYAVFTYLHTGTRHDAITNDRTVFIGQSINWVLNRRIKNTRYTNVTLKGLALKITRQYNLELDMDEEGDLIENVAQVSLTDWAFLSKIVDRQGFAMRTVGRVLQIYKITVNSKQLGYTLKIGENIKSLTIIDQAQTDATGSSQKIEHQGGSITTVVDADSGGFVQNGTPNNRDAGNSSNYTTGVDIPPPQYQKQYTNPRPDNASVKEFQMEIELYTTQLDLENLTPDTALFLDGSIPFITGRSWFIESVTHAYEESVMTTSLRCYVPVAPKAVRNDSGEENQVSFEDSQDGLNGVGNVGSYTIKNWDGPEVTSFETLRPHWRGSSGYRALRNAPNQATGKISYMKNNSEQLVYDFTLFKNGVVDCPVPSPVTGKVSQIEGGYGIVKIEHGDKSTRILHMSNIRVKVGDNVLFGTILGTQAMVDAGGASTGKHVHIETNEFILRRYINALVTGKFE